MRIAIIILLGIFSLSLHAQITSTFDTDADGWTFYNASSTLIAVTHNPANGNPGGYISATYASTTGSSNVNGNNQAWLAPAKFLGNHLVKSLGMNFKFDLQQSLAGTTSVYDVRIASGGNYIYFTLPIKPAVAPAWSSYSLPLDETIAWRLPGATIATRSQIIGILTNVTSITIRGTYATNAAYTSGLDNVILEQRVLGIAPTIGSFSTLSGKPGSSITIQGSGFGSTSSANEVYFGSIAGEITTASSTSLAVTVPVGAAYEKITIINKETGLSKQSLKPFNPTFDDGGRIIPASFNSRFDILLDATAGNDLNGLATADLDGDGWNDLLVTESSINTVSIFRNLGLGGNLSISSFGSKFSLTGAGNRSGVFTVDLDGDGKLDVVTAYVSSPFEYFATHRNVSTPGNLSFESVELWQAVAGNSSVSAVVDVDGDGRPDLIGQTSTGSVSADFWIAQNISTPGDIEFGASIAYFGGSTLDAGAGVSTGDLDNDGIPEIIVKHSFGSQFQIIKNNSTPGVISLGIPFPISQGSNGGIVIADFNLDGKNDIAWKAGSSNDDVRIRINTNSGGALAATDFATEIILNSELSNYGGISVADVNGDGKPDIIASDNADAGVFENKYSGGVFDANAFGSAHQIQGISTSTYPTTPIFSDLNGDNKPELILGFTNTSPLRISIFENKNVRAPEISINTVSPLAAPVGATLTITGDYFSTVPAENVVMVGGVRATVLTATKTELTATVPGGCTYGLVSVTRDMLTAEYRLPFKTTFSSGVTFDNTHFSPPVNFTLTTADYDVEVGDLNKDGMPEVVAEGITNRTYIFRNTHTSGALSSSSLMADDTISSGASNPRLMDIDGDGYLDIIGSSAGLSKNLTTSSEVNFSPIIGISIGANHSFGDLNFDGKMDIVGVNGGNISIAENRSSTAAPFTTGAFGTLSTIINYAKPTTGGGTATADFDNDGWMDFVATNPGTDNVSVWRNDGAYRVNATQFTALPVITVGDSPGRIYPGDLDGDGKMDLVLYHGTGTTNTLIIVLHNTSTVGNISFDRIDLTNPSATTVATIADLDGDGKPEIITTSETGNRFSIFKNLHTSGALTAASFAAPFNTTVTAPRGITTGDLNLDGKPEIILTRAAGLLVVYENLISSIPPPSPPTITSFTPTSGPIGTTVTITGTNFDTTPAGNIVYFGATKAMVSAATATQLTVTVPAGATYQPITVQVSGLSAYSSWPFVVTFAGGGAIDNCSFAPATSVGTVSTLIRSTLFDVDGDGKTDLLVPDRSNNQVSVFRNTSTAGTTSFAPVLNVTGLNTPLSVALGDLDSDGNPDMAVVNYTNGNLSVYKNLSTSGTISFAAKVDFTIPAFSHDVTIADVDGDGKQDLTVITSLNGLIVFRNTGTPGVINGATFAAGVTFATGPNPFSAVLGDIDGDGKLDAAVPNANAYTVSVLRNTSTPGAISFATQTLTIAAGSPSLGLGAASTLLGDIDGDTKLDLVVTVNTFNTVSIYRNTSALGSISFDPKFDIAFPSTSYTPAISDLDGDGKIDLAIDRNATGLSVYKNTATSGAINASSFAVPVILTRSASGINQIGDIDGDGRNDILSTATNIQVFRNLIGTISPATITSFSPTSGVVGTSVTITGTNFNTLFAKTVEFNGTSASITGSTATTLTVTVPAGATTGPVKVTIGCNTITGSNFTVGLPAAITITTQPSDFIACVGQTATFTTVAAGTTNITYQWQFSPDGVVPYTDIANGGGYSNATTATLSVNTAANFGLGRYRCRINGDFAAEVITNDEGLFINPIPTTPTATNTSRCGPGSVTLTTTGGSNGQYRWYTVVTGGTALAGEVNSSYVTPAVTTSTTYFVAINNGSCESLRSPVVATINIPPAIPAITSSITPVGNALTICSTTSLTLTAPTGFSSYSWSTGATTQQISVSTSGSYSVTVTDAAGCVSPTSVALVVTVIPAPCNNQAPVISTTSTSTVIEGQATINLLDLISDADNNLVPSSLAIAQQPTSGASATITNGVLEIDYKGLNFSGRDQVTIRVCDVFGECTQQVLEIEVIGDLEVYNGLSPNNDGLNEIFFIQYIELLPDTQNNKVSIYNRWGSKVFEVENYNNTTNVFRGLNDSGNELPSGTYFYKIEFNSGRKSENGYLSIKR